tara:strand:- start:129 stop:305 length:177 start_codon:yes stop_codon:yes gene_type:complete
MIFPERFAMRNGKQRNVEVFTMSVHVALSPGGVRNEEEEGKGQRVEYSIIIIVVMIEW